MSSSYSFDADAGDIQEMKNTKELFGEFCSESKKLWYLAAPAICNLVLQYSISAVTQIFAGHVGDIQLAAVAVEINLISGFAFAILVSFPNFRWRIVANAFNYYIGIANPSRPTISPFTKTNTQMIIIRKILIPFGRCSQPGPSSTTTTASQIPIARVIPVWGLRHESKIPRIWLRVLRSDAIGHPRDRSTLPIVIVLRSLLQTSEGLPSSQKQHGAASPRKPTFKQWQDSIPTPPVSL
nr:protein DETOXIFICATION 29 isoform X6 [Ipomoea trifida]